MQILYIRGMEENGGEVIKGFIDKTAKKRHSKLNSMGLL